MRGFDRRRGRRRSSPRWPTTTSTRCARSTGCARISAGWRRCSTSTASRSANLRNTLLTAQKLADEIRRTRPQNEAQAHRRARPKGARRPAAPEGAGAARGDRARHRRAAARRGAASRARSRRRSRRSEHALEFIREQDDKRGRQGRCCTARASRSRGGAATARSLTSRRRAASARRASDVPSALALAVHALRRAGRHRLLAVRRRCRGPAAPAIAGIRGDALARPARRRAGRRRRQRRARRADLADALRSCPKRDITIVLRANASRDKRVAIAGADRGRASTARGLSAILAGAQPRAPQRRSSSSATPRQLHHLRRPGAPRAAPAQADARRRSPTARSPSLDGRIVFVGPDAETATATVDARAAARGHRRRAAARSCPASSTRTRTWSSPATAATSCAGGSPAPPTPRSPRQAAASSRRCAATRAATEDDLVAADAGRGSTRCSPAARRRARSRAATASTLETELKHAARHPRGSPASIRSSSSPTFMGAHEVPRRVPRPAATTTCGSSIDEMIPAVAARGARRMVRRVLRDRRLHAGRVARDPRGRAARRAEAAHPRRRARRRAAASQVAAAVGARSADHLIFVDAEAASRAMAAAGVVRHAAADGGVLPEARALRARARC